MVADLLLIALLASAPLGVAADSPPPREDGGGGIVHGPGHAFIVVAPDGWILDNTSGVEPGLHAVFYPLGASWADSDVVMYVNTSAREPDDTLERFILADIARMRAGSPGLRVEKADGILTGGENASRRAQVRHFTGDRWGNYEAVAYLAEEKIFALIVLSAKSETLYDKSYGAFEKLVASYLFITKDVTYERDPPSD